MAKLTVGQTLLYVYDNSARRTTARVAKVGRKWAQLEQAYGSGPTWIVAGRVNVETLVDNTGGQYYLDEDDYQRALMVKHEREVLLASWSTLRNTLQYVYRVPEGVSLEDIDAAAKLLRVELPA